MDRKTERYQEEMKKKIVSVMLMLFMTVSAIACASIGSDVHLTKAQEDTKKTETRYQDDFYEAVNGDLLDKITLDATDAQWTWFGELNAVVNTDMRAIISELSKSTQEYEKGSAEQKIRDLYECISNKENRDATGLGPLQPYLDTIRNAATIDEYVEALANLSGEFGFSSLVGGYYIDQDKKNSGEYAVYMMYADTLIGKEYLESEVSKEQVTFYFDYVEDMLEEFGMSEQESETASREIEALLRDICASSMTAEQYYDPSLTYNPYTEEELQKLYTNIDVPEMLQILRIDGQDKYIVIDVGQAQKVNSLLVEENLETLKNFSTFVMLNDAAEYSTSTYAKLAENLQNQLYGITQSKDDEYTWMNMTQDMLAWDFAEIYVEKYYDEESKEKVGAMIPQIITEYKEIIENQDWMSEETKQNAIEKLNTMGVKIGYPDEWPASKDMMQVTPISEGGSLLSNMLVYMQVSINDSLKKIGCEADRSDWSMTPQTVNAYYDSNNNEIVLPAGILQAPLYDKRNSDEANLGGIGFVIAHEISHAFDANGALYDAQGNYNIWWTEEEMRKYQELSQAIVSYYNGYSVAGGKVNGTLTLSENIADLGAMTCITRIIGNDAKKLDRAFCQMAYIWAADATVSYELYLLNVDTHSPNKVRVNAVLSSCDAFYDTYDIKETDGMYVAPENRVGIWK